MTNIQKTKKITDFREVQKLARSGELIDLKLVFDVLSFSLMYKITYMYKIFI